MELTTLTYFEQRTREQRMEDAIHSAGIRKRMAEMVEDMNKQAQYIAELERQLLVKNKEIARLEQSIKDDYWPHA